MEYANASDAFSTAYSELNKNRNIKKALAESKNSNIEDRFDSLALFHSSYHYGLSLDASIKNQYVIFTELQRFGSSNEDALKDVRIFDEYSEGLQAIEKAFDLCLLDYAENSGDTFQNLLKREGVPNGLPKGYCFYDIVRGIQAYEYIPDNASIPFIVHLNLFCFDMPSEYFENLSKFQSIERLEVKTFGELVPSFEPISKLHKLKHLRIGRCQTSDLTPLARLKNLRYIEFDACDNLSDISPLGEIPSLGTVFFFYSKVSDYSPLLNLKNLTLFLETDENESSQAVHQQVKTNCKASGIQSVSH